MFQKFRSLTRIAVTLFLAAGSLQLQAAQVSPTPAYSVTHNGTATGAGVLVLSDGTSAGGYRTDCTLQNNGTHVMYYKFELPGIATSSVTTADKQLLAGASMNCNDGVTLDSTGLSVLGTNGDTYALSEQFVRAQ